MGVIGTATNHSDAFSARTTGATGRKSSRSLISLSRACMSGRSARPGSIVPRAPWDRTPCAPGTSRGCAPRRAAWRPLPRRHPAGERAASTRQNDSISASGSRAEVGVVHPVPPLRGAALLASTHSAAPATGVAGGRLAPDAVERPPRRGCVHHSSARRPQPGRDRARRWSHATSGRGRGRLLQDDLQRVGDIEVVLVQRSVRAGRTAARDRRLDRVEHRPPVDDAAERIDVDRLLREARAMTLYSSDECRKPDIP